MTNPEEIRKIAWIRVEEALCLCEADLLDGAFYLAGYSVELMLKAKICDRFGIPNLFNEQDGDTAEQKQNLKIAEVRKAVKVHNLFQLLVYSGLKAKFDQDKSTNRSIMKTNSLLFGKWDENCRYLPVGTMKSQSDMRSLLNALKNPDGLLRWIETH